MKYIHVTALLWKEVVILRIIYIYYRDYMPGIVGIIMFMRDFHVVYCVFLGFLSCYGKGFL